MFAHVFFTLFEMTVYDVHFFYREGEEDIKYMDIDREIMKVQLNKCFLFKL